MQLHKFKRMYSKQKPLYHILSLRAKRYKVSVKVLKIENGLIKIRFTRDLNHEVFYVGLYNRPITLRKRADNALERLLNKSFNRFYISKTYLPKTRKQKTMATITIEIEDKDLFQKLLAATGDSGTAAVKTKGKAKDDEGDIREEIEDLLSALSRADKKQVLADYDAKKLDDVEDEDLEDLLEDLKESGDDDDDDELDVETVKKACQAFAKKNGAEEAKEIYADFDINSIRGLTKLDATQLKELFAEVSAA